MELRNNEHRAIPTVSRVLSDGRLIELVRSIPLAKTQLAVSDGHQVEIVDEVTLSPAEHLVPVSVTNNLIQHEAIMLPEYPAAYGDIDTLVTDLVAYFDRYVALSDPFKRFAAYYVLFTWVFDAFDELPYLRLEATWGSGKTRGLIVLGSVCYRGFFASGASTVSPIFHTLDLFRGTLILDEADFRFSDQTAELVKILNNGNVRGFPVFRTAITVKREFDPRAFQVFGPKLVAMRKSFADEALESRFITERLDRVQMHPGIPVNLPGRQREEALTLRNKLLQYRFDNRFKVGADERFVDRTLSPRSNQILVPLLSIIPNEEDRAVVRDMVRSLEHEQTTARSTTREANVVAALCDVFSGSQHVSVAVAEVAARVIERFASDYERPISNRYIGSILRGRLGLQTYKSSGVYRVSIDAERLQALRARYGLLSGDVEQQGSESGRREVGT